MSRPLNALLWLAFACFSHSVYAESFLQKFLNKPVPGGVAVIPLGNAQASAFYQNKPVLIIQDNREYLAVVGIPLSTPQGPQRLEVEQAGQKHSLTFEVSPREYKAQHIRLKNKQQVNPDPQNLKRIEQELELQTQAYRQFSQRYPSNLLFDKPVDGPLSSPFGLRRFFNGEERNPHSGLDFAVPAGTPIKAPAAGTVILVGDYFFNGKTVFVDHGQGLISMFCHMSRTEAKVGNEIPRGGILGWVGATGRATGPHLHWNVSLNDTRVDPSIFIGAFQP